MTHTQQHIPCDLCKLTLAIALALPALGTSLPAFAADTGAQKSSMPQSAKQNINIPAQPLANALNAFIATSDWQVGFPAGLAKDVRANAVSGSYTPQQALEKLLQGTGLVYRVTGDNSVTLEKVAVAEPQTGETTLKPMTVTGAAIQAPNDPYNKSYNVTNASTGTKTDTPLMETPMSVQVVPKAVLDDQQAIRIEDALKNVSGVAKGFGFGTLEDTFIIRGFENSTSTWGLTQIYRDGSLAVGGLFSTADVQRVEVLKGPAAMLYGRLEPGGLVNVVTKRPQVEAAYSIQQQFGSYDTYRTTLGATGSLINDGSLTYRLDVEYLDKNTFRDFTFNEQVHVAPKLTWKVTNQTQIDLEYQYFNQETIIDWGIPVIGNRPAKISSSTFLGEPTDRFPYQTNSGSIMLTHSFNDDWKLQTKYYKFSNQYDDAKFSGENGPASLNEATGDLSRTFYKANHDFNSDYVTMNLDGKFSTWGVDHNVLLGGDWFDSSFTEDGTFFGSTKVASINIFNPVYGNGIGPNTELPINSFAKIDERWFGFYLQDQITFAEDWHLLTGFRFDHAEAKSSFAADRSGVKAVANELSPRVGLLYQPMQWLSLYGSYMQGFNGSVGGRTVDGNALAPNRSRQYEAGIKTEWFDGKLTSSLVFYHLSKSGIATPHTDLNLAQKGFVNQTGEARSQGIEFDISGQVAENWDVIGSYALTDTDITKDRGRDGGTRNQGNRLFSAPVHSGSFWAYHKFGEFSFPEVSVGLGAFVVGQREGDLANSFQLPGYTRLDASLKYTKPIGHTNLTVQFNVQNLLDKEYYSTARPNRVGVTPGEPITFLGSVKLDF
jgi:iron complex outermembrane receptor protein